MSLQDQICKLIEAHIKKDPIEDVVDIATSASEKYYVGLVKRKCPGKECTLTLSFCMSKTKEHPLPLRNIFMGNPKLMMLLLERISGEFSVLLGDNHIDLDDEEDEKVEEPGECIEGKVRERKEGEKD